MPTSRDKEVADSSGAVIPSSGNSKKIDLRRLYLSEGADPGLTGIGSGLKDRGAPRGFDKRMGCLTREQRLLERLE